VGGQGAGSQAGGRSSSSSSSSSSNSSSAGSSSSSSSSSGGWHSSSGRWLQFVHPQACVLSSVAAGAVTSAVGSQTGSAE
jgi:hypothetical protein